MCKATCAWAHRPVGRVRKGPSRERREKEWSGLRGGRRRRGGGGGIEAPLLALSLRALTVECSAGDRAVRVRWLLSLIRPAHSRSSARVHCTASKAEPLAGLWSAPQRPHIRGRLTTQLHCGPELQVAVLEHRSTVSPAELRGISASWAHKD